MSGGKITLITFDLDNTLWDVETVIRGAERALQGLRRRRRRLRAQRGLRGRGAQVARELADRGNTAGAVHVSCHFGRAAWARPAPNLRGTQ